MPSRARTTAIRVWALAAVVLALLVGTLPGGWLRASAAPLEAGSDFTIESRISSSATSADRPALLLPGVTRYLWYTVSNPLGQPITVTDLSVSAVEAPPTCPATSLDLGDPSFAGAFVVPAGSALTVPAPRPISLRDWRTVNQDGCKDVTFTFTFVGTARYSDGPEPVGRTGTSIVLASGPNPSAVGGPVTLTAQVIPGATLRSRTVVSAAPSGMVSFYLDGSLPTLLGSRGLAPDGSANLRLTTLPAGTGRLYAVYAGDATFAGSTSPRSDQLVVAPPAQCAATYATSILGTPTSPTITGTSGNDFIYAVGGSYRISAGRGNDCIVVGDGTNVIRDGSGSDVVVAGDGRNTVTLTGSRNTLIVGDGSSNRIYVRGAKKGAKRYKPKANRVAVGDGSGNYVKVSKGARNVVSIGSGPGNRVTALKGFRNQVRIGDGSANRVWMKGRRTIATVGGGGWNRITLKGAYKSRVTVGDGDRNQVSVKGRKARVTVGDGEANRITVRNWRARVTVGDGDRNQVSVKGRKARVAVGDGDGNRITVRYSRARVTVGDGSANRVTVRGTRARVTLGAGTGNAVAVTRGPVARSRCSVPVPPPWWGRSPAGFYGDRIIGCRVGTR